MFQKVKYAESYYDENQGEGDDATMIVHEFLVDYVLMTCTYLKLLFNLMCMHIYIYMCTLHVVIFWQDNFEWYNSYSISYGEHKNATIFFSYDRAYRTIICV